MNRSEMLSELREVINDDTSYPEWTDTTLAGYLSDGKDKFCEDTGYFRDSSTFLIELVAGVTLYEIPQRIIQILAIWNGSTKLQKILTGETYDELGYAWSIGTGMPSQWRTDTDTGLIVFNNTPTATEAGTTLSLSVWRYGFDDLLYEESEPEIPERFHRACIEWAAYKAFNHHDAETQDPVKAADHLQAYRMYVNDAVSAMRRYHNDEVRIGSNSAYRT